MFQQRSAKDADGQRLRTFSYRAGHRHGGKQQHMLRSAYLNLFVEIFVAFVYPSSESFAQGIFSLQPLQLVVCCSG